MSSKVIPRASVGVVRRLEPEELGSAAARTGAQAATPEEQATVPAEDAQSAALDELERRLEHVREEAYRAGLEAGRREALAMADIRRAEVQALITGINELMESFEQRLANDLLSISLELAKVVVRAGVRVKPAVVLPVLREAIASLPGMPEQTNILLNPEDAELVREFFETEPAAPALPWTIVEDAHIERGGCKLESATTEVDATLETRWRRVIAALGRDDAWLDIAL